MLRVKNGPCAPLKLSSMLSCPATGITVISAIVGAVTMELTAYCTGSRRFADAFCAFAANAKL